MILLVVDMQKELVCDDLYAFDKFIKNVTKLIDAARKNKVEVIYYKHDGGSGSGLTVGDLGFEIAECVKPRDDEKVYVKTINSCFGNPEFVKYLNDSGEKELMIVGLQTEYCIDATIKSAFERGFKVYVPKSTNSTFDNNYLSAKKAVKYYNEWIWPDLFSESVTINEAIKVIKNRKY